QHGRVCLVVPAAGGAASVDGLAGKVVCLPREARAYCRLFLERKCVGAGADAGRFFAKVSRPAAEEDALADVAAGRADGAVVEAAALEGYRRDRPAAAKRLRVLKESEAFPPGVVGYCPGRLSEAEAAKVRKALVAAKDHAGGRQSLAVLKLAALEPPPEGHDRVLRDVAKAYPHHGKE